MPRFVDSDDPIVADLLMSTIELVAEAGGWIAPSTTFVSRNGQLHVESTEKEGNPLLHIPSTAFIRVDDVTWGNDPDRLEILEINHDLGELELELLYIQVALHNQTQKLTWMSTTHPWLAPNLPKEVIEAVRLLLPTFRTPEMTTSDTLWANRCFRIALDTESQPQRLLIPLVDLLNHHNRGATGSWAGNAFDVAAVMPFGSQECALNYGINRDHLEMAAVYGFIDSSDAITIKRAGTSAMNHELLEALIDACSHYPTLEACNILGGGAKLQMQKLIKS